MKTCTKCLESKEACEFSNHKRTLDGLNSWCKVCVKERSRQHYEQNKDKVNARAKAWREANPDKAKLSARQSHERRDKLKMREVTAKHYQQNREVILQRSRQRYQQNRELRLQHYHQYRSTIEGRAKQLIRSAKQRSQSKGWQFDLDWQFIAELLESTPVCPLLDIPLLLQAGNGVQPDTPSLDRIDSSKGYTRDNVKVISWRANQIKSNASYEEFLTIAQNLPGYYREQL